MKAIRKVNNVTLNEGSGQAKGLYNLFNKDTNEVSLWFDKDAAYSLLKMSDEEFLHEARVKFEISEMAEFDNFD